MRATLTFYRRERLPLLSYCDRADASYLSVCGYMNRGVTVKDRAQKGVQKGHLPRQRASTEVSRE